MAIEVANFDILKKGGFPVTVLYEMKNLQKALLNFVPEELKFVTITQFAPEKLPSRAL